MSTVSETETGETGSVCGEVIETEAIGNAIVFAIATVTMTGRRAPAVRTRLLRMIASDVTAKKSVNVPIVAA